MRKKSQISEEDKALFQEAMRSVKKISPPNKTIIAKKVTKNSIKISLKPAQKKESITISDFEDQTILGPKDLIEFNRGGVQHKILRKLRSGQYNVEATLDLHGMKVVEAKAALESFLLECYNEGCTVLMVIHGKGLLTGKPILKNKLNNWLRQIPFVLAFSSAKHSDGSSGGLYVLLRGNKFGR